MRSVSRSLSTLLILALAGPATGQSNAPTTRPATPPNHTGTVTETPVSEADLDRIAELRGYPEAFRRIRHEHFGRIRSDRLRQAGLRELRQFPDPAALRPMWRTFREEPDDVRLAILDHFLDQGDEGQAALAWVAMHEDDETAASRANQYEATRRLVGPASPDVIASLNTGLTNQDSGVANRAASIAGTLDALEVIPQLIMNQAFAPSFSGDDGDLAWIAVGRQTVYIAEVVPIVGNNAVAFQPIPAVLTEGFVFRVHDAVAIIYRTIVHRVLVTMTTDDWGQPTDHLGYDVRAWAEWYNDEYVPYKNEQLAIARLAEEPDPATVPPSQLP